MACIFYESENIKYNGNYGNLYGTEHEVKVAVNFQRLFCKIGIGKILKFDPYLQKSWLYLNDIIMIKVYIHWNIYIYPENNNSELKGRSTQISC